MREENIVRDLYVSEGGRALKASYFVEAGILHASIQGRTVTLPVGADGSEETMRRLLIGQLQTKSWRDRFFERFRREKAPTSGRSRG